MSRSVTWRDPAVALLLVGLVLAVCLRESAEASSVGGHACTAISTEQLTLSKTPLLSLWAIAIEVGTSLDRLQLLSAALPEAPLDFVSVALWGDRSSRSPPA